ncbi:uncharacterized protein LOC131698077 isoform X1 [Acipenser ruthenus]|uniref:uncharacterized protein LOC131698077 isoform X1 n=1 Tax=Acipenser ruthenus TaxID=7906 RepID=UPI0027408919|nr:uncharacterized protein LOC131698077 isoform X1 [Acipenser ruthenus]XP_058846486.1 uncharacterized protein LOC131698077 isoform X1 [Acipenser ruthenus]XP_058846487.1 uncharacterized protein LOC131698077 isoform X1 [Acipenser ruthenus]XP_058846488.1 uncharacterized protein LOC131698077 isoform X1 [Acipenser ruthenus]XP_058846489.1 uncharacterized protein LOC131698077 isoform X1 [Acipenser ruthenus]
MEESSGGNRSKVQRSWNTSSVCDGQPSLRKFTIPRRKKHSEKTFLEDCPTDWREYSSIRSILKESRLDISRDIFLTWKCEGVKCVHNEELEKEFAEKRSEMRSKGRNRREMEERFCFLVTSDSVAMQLYKDGVKTDATAPSTLGNPLHGIYLYRHVDVALKHSCQKSSDAAQRIVIFKVIFGKVKNVQPCFGKKVALDPTVKADCHMSNNPASPKDTVIQQVVGSSIYLFDYSEDQELVSRPRQCLPYAVVSISGLANDTMAPSTTLLSLKKPYPRELSGAVKNHRIDKRRGRGQNATAVYKQFGTLENPGKSPSLISPGSCSANYNPGKTQNGRLFKRQPNIANEHEGENVLLNCGVCTPEQLWKSTLNLPGISLFLHRITEKPQESSVAKCSTAMCGPSFTSVVTSRVTKDPRLLRRRAATYEEKQGIIGQGLKPQQLECRAGNDPKHNVGAVGMQQDEQEKQAKKAVGHTEPSVQSAHSKLELTKRTKNSCQMETHSSHSQLGSSKHLEQDPPASLLKEKFKKYAEYLVMSDKDRIARIESLKNVSSEVKKLLYCRIQFYDRYYKKNMKCSQYDSKMTPVSSVHMSEKSPSQRFVSKLSKIDDGCAKEYSGVLGYTGNLDPGPGKMSTELQQDDKTAAACKSNARCVEACNKPNSMCAGIHLNPSDPSHPDLCEEKKQKNPKSGITPGLVKSKEAGDALKSSSELESMKFKEQKQSLGIMNCKDAESEVHMSDKSKCTNSVSMSKGDFSEMFAESKSAEMDQEVNGEHGATNHSLLQSNGVHETSLDLVDNKLKDKDALLIIKLGDIFAEGKSTELQQHGNKENVCHSTADSLKEALAESIDPQPNVNENSKPNKMFTGIQPITANGMCEDKSMKKPMEEITHNLQEKVPQCDMETSEELENSKQKVKVLIEEEVRYAIHMSAESQCNSSVFRVSRNDGIKLTTGYHAPESGDFLTKSRSTEMQQDGTLENTYESTTECQIQCSVELGDSRSNLPFTYEENKPNNMFPEIPPDPMKEDVCEAKCTKTPKECITHNILQSKRTQHLEFDDFFPKSQSTEMQQGVEAEVGLKTATECSKEAQWNDSLEHWNGEETEPKTEELLCMDLESGKVEHCCREEDLYISHYEEVCGIDVFETAECTESDVIDLPISHVCIESDRNWTEESALDCMCEDFSASEHESPNNMDDFQSSESVYWFLHRRILCRTMSLSTSQSETKMASDKDYFKDKNPYFNKHRSFCISENKHAHSDVRVVPQLQIKIFNDVRTNCITKPQFGSLFSNYTSQSTWFDTEYRTENLNSKSTALVDDIPTQHVLKETNPVQTATPLFTAKHRVDEQSQELCFEGTAIKDTLESKKPVAVTPKYSTHQNLGSQVIVDNYRCVQKLPDALKSITQSSSPSKEQPLVNQAGTKMIHYSEGDSVVCRDTVNVFNASKEELKSIVNKLKSEVPLCQSKRLNKTLTRDLSPLSKALKRLPKSSKQLVQSLVKRNQKPSQKTGELEEGCDNLKPRKHPSRTAHNKSKRNINSNRYVKKNELCLSKDALNTHRKDEEKSLKQQLLSSAFSSGNSKLTCIKNQGINSENGREPSLTTVLKNPSDTESGAKGLNCEHNTEQDSICLFGEKNRTFNVLAANCGHSNIPQVQDEARKKEYSKSSEAKQRCDTVIHKKDDSVILTKNENENTMSCVNTFTATFQKGNADENKKQTNTDVTKSPTQVNSTGEKADGLNCKALFSPTGTYCDTILERTGHFHTSRPEAVEDIHSCDGESVDRGGKKTKNLQLTISEDKNQAAKMKEDLEDKTQTVHKGYAEKGKSIGYKEVAVEEVSSHAVTDLSNGNGHQSQWETLPEAHEEKSDESPSTVFEANSWTFTWKQTQGGQFRSSKVQDTSWTSIPFITDEPMETEINSRNFRPVLSHDTALQNEAHSVSFPSKKEEEVDYPKSLKSMQSSNVSQTNKNQHSKRDPEDIKITSYDVHQPHIEAALSVQTVQMELQTTESPDTTIQIQSVHPNSMQCNADWIRSSGTPKISYSFKQEKSTEMNANCKSSTDTMLSELESFYTTLYLKEKNVKEISRILKQADGTSSLDQLYLQSSKCKKMLPYFISAFQREQGVDFKEVFVSRELLIEKNLKDVAMPVKLKSTALDSLLELQMMMEAMQFVENKINFLKGLPTFRSLLWYDTTLYSELLKGNSGYQQQSSLYLSFQDKIDLGGFAELRKYHSQLLCSMHPNTEGSSYYVYLKNTRELEECKAVLQKYSDCSCFFLSLPFSCGVNFGDCIEDLELLRKNIISLIATYPSHPKEECDVGKLEHLYSMLGIVYGKISFLKNNAVLDRKISFFGVEHIMFDVAKTLVWQEQRQAEEQIAGTKKRIKKQTALGINEDAICKLRKLYEKIAADANHSEVPITDRKLKASDSEKKRPRCDLDDPEQVIDLEHKKRKYKEASLEDKSPEKERNTSKNINTNKHPPLIWTYENMVCLTELKENPAEEKPCQGNPQYQLPLTGIMQSPTTPALQPSINTEFAVQVHASLPRQSSISRRNYRTKAVKKNRLAMDKNGKSDQQIWNPVCSDRTPASQNLPLMSQDKKCTIVSYDQLSCTEGRNVLAMQFSKQCRFSAAGPKECPSSSLCGATPSSQCNLVSTLNEQRKAIVGSSIPAETQSGVLQQQTPHGQSSSIPYPRYWFPYQDDRAETHGYPGDAVSFQNQQLAVSYPIPPHTSTTQYASYFNDPQHLDYSSDYIYPHDYNTCLVYSGYTYASGNSQLPDVGTQPLPGFNVPYSYPQCPEAGLWPSVSWS